VVIHDEQIGSGTVGLRANKQIGAPVSLSWPKQKSIATIVFNYLWIIRDTRISEWKASPRVESTSCGNLASPTVEDELGRNRMTNQGGDGGDVSGCLSARKQFAGAARLSDRGPERG
jgi:hypothetical protein